MPHNINESRTFYYGEKPWHGIGKELNHPGTAKEAIEAANLDYKVELRPAAFELEEGNFKKVQGDNYIIRSDNKIELGRCTSVYHPIQNVEAFDFFDRVVGTGQAIYHTAGALGKGEKIWILAKLPEKIVIGKDDVVEKYLVLVNCHDGHSALKMYFTPIRVVCQNTLNQSLVYAKDGIAIRHCGELRHKIVEAQRVLQLSNEFYGYFGEKAQVMAKKKLNVEDAENYFKAVLFERNDKDTAHKERIRNRLLTLFEKGMGNSMADIRHSVWTAYNALAEYTDHEATIRNLDGDKSNRLKNIWFGVGAQLKEKGWDRACTLAGIK